MASWLILVKYWLRELWMPWYFLFLRHKARCYDDKARCHDDKARCYDGGRGVMTVGRGWGTFLQITY